MKKHLPRWISLLLVLALLMSRAPCFAQKEDGRIIRVRCVSRLNDMETVNLLLMNGKTYIAAYTAGRLSGFEPTGDNVFCRNDEKRHVDKWTRWNGIDCIEFESGLAQLDTEISMLGDVLVFNNYGSGIGALLEVADKYMIDRNYYKPAYDSEASIWNFGWAYSDFFNSLMSGEWLEAITVEYNEEIFNDVLMRILSPEELDEDTASTMKANEFMNKIIDIADAVHDKRSESGGNTIKQLMNILVEAEGIPELKDALLKLFDDLAMDNKQKPFDYMLKTIILSDELAMKSLYNSIAFVETLDTAAGKRALSTRPGYVRSAINSNMKSLKASGFKDTLDVVGDKVFAFLWDKLSDVLDDIIIDMIFPELYLIIAAELMDLISGGLSDKLRYIEYAHCTYDLAELSRELYMTYRKDLKSAVNAKYAAILYYRSVQIDRKLILDQGFFTQKDPAANSVQREAKAISAIMAELAAFDDSDLTVKNVKNKRIALKTLEAMADACAGDAQGAVNILDLDPLGLQLGGQDDGSWDCPQCGRQGLVTKYCGACGCKRPVAEWTCPNCGRGGLTTNFCTDCGAKKTEVRGYIEAGDRVIFGHYEQDGNEVGGAEPIEWQVLETDGKTAKLISVYGLEAKAYDDTWEDDITWESCTLRTWLNEEFTAAAFTPEEEARLVETRVSADRNPENDTDPGRATKDRVYLLSIAEADKYFADDAARVCYPSKAVESVCEGIEEGESCWWWLRSPGNCGNYAANVTGKGEINNYGDYIVFETDEAVRPVVVVRLI